MKILFLMSVAFLALSNFAYGQSKKIGENVKVVKLKQGKALLWGKYFYLAKRDRRNVIKQEHYFHVNDNGSSLAYPIRFKNPQARKYILEQRDKNLYVEARYVEKVVVINEQRQKVVFLEINDAKAIGLADIGVKGHGEIAPGPGSLNNNSGPQSDKATIRGLNDTATNAIIFGAGAALLATILMGK